MSFPDELWGEIMNFNLVLSSGWEGRPLRAANALRLVCKAALEATKTREWRVGMISNVPAMRLCFPKLGHLDHGMRSSSDFEVLVGIPDLYLGFFYRPKLNSFHHLRDLQVLEVYFGNGNVNLDEVVPHLPALRSLTASGPLMTMTPKCFEFLRGIEKLEVVREAAPSEGTLDVDVFEPLRGIRELHLNGNYTIPVDAFRHLVGIQSLQLTNCTYSGKAFKYLCGLKSLDLGYSTVETDDSDFAPLAGLLHLSMECFVAPRLTDAVFAHLRGLHSISMFECEISFESPVFRFFGKVDGRLDVQSFSANWPTRVQDARFRIQPTSWSPAENARKQSVVDELAQSVVLPSWCAEELRAEFEVFESGFSFGDMV